MNKDGDLSSQLRSAAFDMEQHPFDLGYCPDPDLLRRAATALETPVSGVAEMLNRLAAEQPTMRTLQELYDALTDEARDMVRSILHETLP